MPNKIKPKRSYTANAVPTTSDLDANELAINWADGKAFTKNAAGNIVSISLGGGGGGGAAEDARWDYFKPLAPTNVTATAANAQAVVSWTAPAIVVPPVTDYTVQFSTNGGTTWTTASDSVSTATTATISNLVNGSAHVFRVAAVNGIGTGPYSTASAAVTPTAGDALFSSVRLLLPGDSNVNDASAYNRSVTAVGGAAASTAQKKWGAGSLYFDGSGDYLTIPSSTSLDFGGGDFVVEAWFRTSQGTADATLIVREWVSDPWENAWTVQFTSSSALRIYSTAHSSGVPLLVGSTPCRDGNWHHFAWVRTGSSHKLFLDGVLDASATSSASWTSAAKNITVGNDLTFGSGGRAYEGYIDDLRITVGSDRGYGTGSSITVPVQAFPTEGPMFAPTSLSATGGNAQVSLTWTAPSYNGGSAITNYSVQYSTNGGTDWTTFSRTASTTASQVVSSLTNGTAYVFRVAGINANGTGTYTAASSSVTPNAAAVVTGGTASTPGDGYVYRTFTSSGTLGISGAALTADVLVVGGGGGGGKAGGGGGGVLYQTGQTLNAGSYVVTVADSVNPNANAGSSSLGASYTATGGAGGVNNWVTGGTSGFPTSTSNTTGNAGGAGDTERSDCDYVGGGGGGAGGAGSTPPCNVQFAGGGAGRLVFGTTYGAGGGGVDQDGGTNAPANLGRGGSGTNSRGGSGIVIIRYPVA